MADSDGESLYEGKEYIPMDEKLDKWADVEPIEQYTQENDPGVCKIDYTPGFEEAMRYFRALLNSNEISRRMLELTQVVIKVNYGCYTAWYIRRKCLDEIGTEEDWQNEIKYLNKIGIALEKNYQIWHHRRCIVQKLNDPSNEKQFMEGILKSDDKNYHAWSYRIWFIKYFNLFDGEMEFIEKMIQDNPVNNSAWSYRYFLVNHTKEFGKETVEQEIQYAFQQIKDYKLDNEAPWVYIRGFLAKTDEEAKRSQRPNSSAKRIIITDFPFVKETCLQMLKDYEEGAHGYRFINILLLDYLIGEGLKEEANEVIDKLATVYDPIRENYWKYRKIS
ncbi:unnamed protein product [Moneuplotes crassus]|uniref:Protein farnesyltransferase/geranylgeranyltransferase type-1 subunit alpha n=1 Tax=Euplotes crassus TaxID=5936 RepID=A0AAD1XK85_EUPCR|nr:unnamed protein product [Moneuplotes crassus]